MGQDNQNVSIGIPEKDNPLKAALDWATERLRTPPSSQTQLFYMKTMARLLPGLKDGILPGQVKSNRRTRGVERSAFRYWAAMEINRLVSSKPRRAKRIFDTVLLVDAEADAAQRKYLEESARMREAGESMPASQERNSKRKSIRWMPDAWRETLVESAAGSMYAIQIQLMAATGCRPAEMAKGIRVRRFGDAVIFKVMGAKHSTRTGGGQRKRLIAIAADNPLVAGLKNGLYKAPARAIENAVEHYAHKLWPRKVEQISAYSLRHAAASDFKACGLSDQDVAAALGHQTTATMSMYGTANKGRGGLKLLSVKAAAVVRLAKLKSRYKNKSGKMKPKK